MFFFPNKNSEFFLISQKKILEYFKTYLLKKDTSFHLYFLRVLNHFFHFLLNFQKTTFFERKNTQSSEYSIHSKTGTEGFEPTNIGTKNRCLTTWRRPKFHPRIDSEKRKSMLLPYGSDMIFFFLKNKIWASF